MTQADGTQERGFAPDAWVYDHDADIAVAEWVDGSDHRMWMGMRGEEKQSDKIPTRLADEVIYLGLLSPVPSLAQIGTPVARSATVAALNAPEVELGSGRVLKDVHLVDVRSRQGFSGSPCWLHKTFVSADRIRDSATGSLVPPDYGIFAFGMLVGFGERDGLGVVVPFEKIWELVVNNDELRRLREVSDERAASAPGDRS